MFIFGLAIGLQLGAILYRWWIVQDIRHLRKTVAALEDKNKRLVKFASRSE